MRENQKSSCSRKWRLLFAAVLSCMIFLAAGGTTVYAAKKPKLNKTTVYMLKGQTVKLKVKNTKKKITWKSSKPSVVSVSKKGKIKARKNGEAVISAKIKGGKTLKCSVYVGKYQWIRGRVLASKKSESGWKYLNVKKEINEEGGYTQIKIYAKKGSSKLKFEYYVKYVEPDETFKATMTLDSETAKKVKGYANFSDYGESSAADFVLTKKAFDGIVRDGKNPAGIVFSNYFHGIDGGDWDEQWDSDMSEEEIAARKEFYNQETARVLTGNLKSAFQEWEAVLKKYKVLLKDIGFTKL